MIETGFVSQTNNSLWQATEVIALIQKAYMTAQDIRSDPFVIKRPMPETREVIVPVFQPFEREREKLQALMVVGYGQVGYFTLGY